MRKENIGYLLKQLNDRIKIYADASLKKNNVTFSQTIVLEFIHSQGGETTQKEIEDYLGVAHPTVVGLVSRLEKNGFLTCFTDQEDRRNKIVRITEYAKKFGDAMQAEMDTTEQRLISGLSENEISELRRMLRILYRNME